MAELCACQYRRKEINSMLFLDVNCYCGRELDENDTAGSEG
jgi:hypothetical protein